MIQTESHTEQEEAVKSAEVAKSKRAEKAAKKRARDKAKKMAKLAEAQGGAPEDSVEESDLEEEKAAAAMGALALVEVVD